MKRIAIYFGDFILQNFFKASTIQFTENCNNVNSKKNSRIDDKMWMFSSRTTYMYAVYFIFRNVSLHNSTLDR